ncbi:MAG TPA: type IX secretion system outer membrane channel protein PorV [Bacteroidales bacterium]|nr:type IX secretion system outer membrane channel protein PorV [Bacteroidales bacterium]HRZ50014.1 type IX secretion system outer membrane channel protein PorV [Bacteroidales bacterium]
MTAIKQKISALLLSIGILAPLATLQAQTTYQGLFGQGEINTITTAVPFLMIAPDARAGALGDAGVAGTPDAFSQHWNPAKYAFMKNRMGVSVSYSPWMKKLVDDIDLGYLSFYYKLNNDRDAISASLLFFSLGEIQFTNDIGQDIGTFSPSEYAMDVAYSSKLAKHLSASIAFRYIYSNLTGNRFVGGMQSNAGQTVAGDLSAYYRLPLKVNGQNSFYSAGLNISNIGAKVSYTETVAKDFIPTNLRIGTAFETQLDDYNSIGILLDFNKLLVPTPPEYKYNDSTNMPEVDPQGNYIIARGKSSDVGVVKGIFQSFGDAPDGFGEELREISLSVGAEYWYDKQFAFRAGYFHEHVSKGNRKYFTLGVGLKLNVFGLDFSYLIPTGQRNPLENTLRFSLQFDFESLGGK